MSVQVWKPPPELLKLALDGVHGRGPAGQSAELTLETREGLRHGVNKVRTTKCNLYKLLNLWLQQWQSMCDAANFEDVALLMLHFHVVPGKLSLLRVGIGIHYFEPVRIRVNKPRRESE
ncbi:hypothetical protein IFM89_022649 [Coptis chinensis]|uniref:Uncharacterized protein n=1 Tax=Coptis chinensis TaxID=261450 RepID=A0A835H037_9MAGN|nr:hypothetical protein IFM89_022649 [Coptis chinensis]